MNMTLLSLLLALAGLAVASYIAHKKHTAQPMVCPMKGNCESVTTSRFSKLFGIHVEWLGMTYYGFLALGYTALYVGADLAWLAPALFALTAAGFLFSLYLTLIQLAVLRQLCTWCLISAAITTALFVVGCLQGGWTQLVTYVT